MGAQFRGHPLPEFNMKRCLMRVACVLLFFTCGSSVAWADVIHTFDFVTEFTQTLPEAGAGGTNNSGRTSGSFTADRNGGSGSKGIRLVSNGLNISTAGFKDITLNFSVALTGTFDFNLADGGLNSITGNGLLITGDIDSGLFSLPSSASPVTVNFSSAYDNGNLDITSLNFLAAVNANDQVLIVSGATLQGTAVPEPSSLALLTSFGLLVFRRRGRERFASA